MADDSAKSLAIGFRGASHSDFLSSSRLNGMNKNRIRVRWAQISRNVQGTADCTPVVGAVVDEVEKHFFAGHCAAFSVKKTKVDFFRQRFRWRRFGVGLQPAI